MNQKIFIVEDDPVITKVLEEHLTQWGFSCCSVVDFQHVDQEIQAFEADLVLLDISLPFYNGFYWCQEIRKDSEVPIVFLSSANDNMNMVMAMNLGGDDFIPKPFDLSVLVAKIQALLRRSYQFGQHQQEYHYTEYELNPQENVVKRRNESVLLTPNESKILLLLFQHVGKIVPREDIMEKLWEGDEFVDSNTLAVNMTRLRKKLSAIGLDKAIQTVKNKGYLLEDTDE
ncbi:response regulator transcription factor [Enterococcus sp. AZ192]|uniref:response regulator transcription factor n=1 Tax=unclassified Enterococcus TaxID=2608891 RepID=UPI003D2C10A8